MPLRAWIAAALSLPLSACLAVPNRPDSPVPLASNVDIPRFMGDWYVIAHVPAFNDRVPFNAIEHYDLRADGVIQTTYTSHPGGFEADEKVMRPTGHVVEGTGNALWGMQFVPLVRAEYRVAYLEPDYSVTIIGRSDLDYVWLMSRSPAMDEAAYQRYVTLIAGWGYDTSRLRKVPQRRP